MKKFRKLVVLEPIRFDSASEEALHRYAEEVVVYRDIPADDEEKIRRIGDADALLVFYTSRIGADVINACGHLKYIGMCCSLYTPESANVDVNYAENRGITVTGIRRYGDRGVAEFIASELVRLFHGFGGMRWRSEEMELVGARIGIVGMGDVGTEVTRLMQAFDMDVSYYSRTRKPEIEKRGVQYLPFNELLEKTDILTTHLHKNTVVMGREEFERFGNGKILINTTFTAPYPLDELKRWLQGEGNYYIVDSAVSIGGKEGEIYRLPNVICPDIVAGQSSRSGELLRQKVLENLENYQP
ncbi:dihydrofolate reductase [Ruminococcus sp. CLA-AA-H200]|uniref:Dihydrofolate reductase n=1 Tax=Ruminococcus turbiniformis TaxID=2881258 RepID=A0ABS8FY96_9FIRM|nr:NAD(P)-dependent oxidoreductase [Ruminococcus turbiniformis]MCC2255035.1 dihydrofolate reductase [Ruminococcus turbiniformis]